MVDPMRATLTLIATIYVAGIGVELAPVFMSKAPTDTVATMGVRALRELPRAVAWPERVIMALFSR